MKPYRFDGIVLRDKHNRLIAKVDGQWIRNPKDVIIGKAENSNLRNPADQIIASFDGNSVFDKLGHKLGSIDSIRGLIDGPGGFTLAALWFFCIR